MKKILKSRMAVFLALILAFSFGVNTYATEKVSDQPADETAVEAEITLPAVALPADEVVPEKYEAASPGEVPLEPDEAVVSGETALEEDAAVALNDDEDSGDVGSIHWTYSGEPDCILTLTGTGTVPNPRTEGDQAWNYYCYEAKQLIIGEGITGIDDGAFGYMGSLTEYPALPSTLDESKVSPGAFPQFDCLWDENNNVVIAGILFDHDFSETEEPEPFVIPKEIRALGTESGFQRNPDISEFQVESGNGFFAVEDGVLYNADKTRLIAYPCGSTADSFQVPDSVTAFDQEYIFRAPDSLKHLTFGTGLSDISLPAFVMEEGVEKQIYPEINVGQLYHLSFDQIAVPAGNSTFSSDDKGALYNKNKTTLFYYPRSTETATIGSPVTTLAYRSFDSCSVLTELTLPDSLQVLEGYALSDCASLTNLELPSTVTRLDAQAFAGNQKLQVHFTGPVPEISKEFAGNNSMIYAFYPADDADWEAYVNGSGQQVKNVHWMKEGEILNPDLVDWGEIGDIQWQYGLGETLNFTGKGIIPNPDDLPYGAWNRYADACQQIAIGEGITGIAQDAFYDLPELNYLSLPDSMENEQISPGAFGQFGETMYDENGNVIIGDILFDHDFEGVYEPEPFSIPANVRELGTRTALLSSDDISAYEVADGNPYLAVKDGALFTKDFTELIAYPCGAEEESFTFPDATEGLRQDTFRKSNALTQVQFGTGLADLSLPAIDEEGVRRYPDINVGKLYNRYFDKITVPAGNSTFSSDANGALYNKNKTTLFYYPRSAETATIGSPVTTLAYRSFDSCSKLMELTLPDSLQVLEGYSVSDCDGLLSLDLPASVKRIDGAAFSGCEKLKAIRFQGAVPEIDEDMVGYRAAGQSDLVAIYPNDDKAWDNYVKGDGAKVKNIKWVAEEKQKDISACNIRTVVPKTMVYNGKPYKPAVTITDGNLTLSPKDDYTVLYSNNVNAGNATITITGKGLYTGKATRYFTIAKAKNPMKVKPLTVNVLYNKKKAQKIKLKVTKAQGKVTFKSSNKKQVTVNSKGVVTVRKGAKAGKYVITVTAKGNKNYLKGVQKVKITVVKKKLRKTK